MVPNVYIACDGDWNEPEIQISGTKESLSNFGCYLKKVNETRVLKLKTNIEEFYPVKINKLKISLEKVGMDKIKVMVTDDCLYLEGTSLSLSLLGESLENFFDDNSNSGDHFQMDYYEGDCLLSETNCALIFLCV